MGVLDKNLNRAERYIQFCRNYENHCNDAEWFSDNYHCDLNVYNASTSLTEALWIDELLVTSYRVSGRGEGLIISYLEGRMTKEDMIIQLILAGDKNVKALRDQRDKHSANEKPRTFSTRRGGNRVRQPSHKGNCGIKSQRLIA